MELRIETGHTVSGDVVRLETDTVRFVAENGKTMFEVRVNGPHSISVRGVDVCKVGERIYGTHLLVQPNASNDITIQAPIYR